MKEKFFSLIICTYKRPYAVEKLLLSIKDQTLYPNEIIIVDGSPDNLTKELLEYFPIKDLKYFKVDENNRGLTKQRNYGLSKISDQSQIICFLDDDIVLTDTYFERLIKSYQENEKIGGVGGYILNRKVLWEKVMEGEKRKFIYYYFDQFKRKLDKRFILRKLLGLFPDKPPGWMPEFSHGLSISFLPPTGKLYPVEFFMGGVSSYKREIFHKYSFSTYFEGYGLYEDMDFCLRISKEYPLYVNTAAQLYHYHEESGRPNKFNYGKMVIRNGWYVWRIKYSNPTLKARLKWHAAALVLTVIRFLNVMGSRKKVETFTEAIGRVYGWFSLFFNPPKIQTP